jgi:hypothetical protein
MLTNNYKKYCKCKNDVEICDIMLNNSNHLLNMRGNKTCYFGLKTISFHMIDKSMTVIKMLGNK